MLLACCFREPKTNKRSKKSKKSSGDDEDAYMLTKSLISAPLAVSSSCDLEKKIKLQDQRSSSAVPSPESVQKIETVKKVSAHVEPTKSAATQIKEEVKLQQNSVIKPSFNASTPVSKYPTPAQHVALSPNFTNISAIKKKEEVKDVRRMLATPEDLDESYVSLSKINNDSFTSNTSKDGLKKSVVEEEIKSNSEDKSKTFVKDDNKKLTEFNEENLKLKEIIEQQKRKLELQEKSIKALSNECKSTVEALKNEHNLRLQEEKNCYNLKLLEEKENHRKEIENAKIIAKNSANETISQLNKQIVAERAKMFAEQQDTKKRMEEEFKMKEDRLQQSLACLEQSLTMVEKRELEWQEEKADILEEVQRLKAEASKMIQILAEEYEEENLSEEKKRSLSAEVYSLQLVVEMRTGEVRSLREKLGIVTHQMESQAVTQSQLDKALARIEDLEEQLKVKIQMERQLSVEKSELEQNVAISNKVVDRMSMNVEQLQWRIKNNYDLPVQNFTSEPSSGRMQSSAETQHISTPTQQLRSPKLVEKVSKFNHSSRKQSLFVVSDEMIEATTTFDEKLDPSDISPSSDFTDDSIEACEGDKEDDNSINNNIEDIDHDVDSLDEGVGDVSSDGENQLSPGYVKRSTMATSSSSCETVVTNSLSQSEESKFEIDVKVNKGDHVRRLSSPRISPSEERIPSRFSFNNTA